MKLEDIESKTLELLLNFCYCEKVMGLKENALKLLDAANKFQIVQLKEVCIKSLIENLNKNNIWETLRLASKLGGTSRLFSECMDFISR